MTNPTDETLVRKLADYLLLCALAIALVTACSLYIGSFFL